MEVRVDRRSGFPWACRALRGDGARPYGLDCSHFRPASGCGGALPCQLEPSRGAARGGVRVGDPCGMIGEGRLPTADFSVDDCRLRLTIVITGHHWQSAIFAISIDTRQSQNLQPTIGDLQSRPLSPLAQLVERAFQLFELLAVLAQCDHRLSSAAEMSSRAKGGPKKSAWNDGLGRWYGN